MKPQAVPHEPVPYGGAVLRHRFGTRSDCEALVRLIAAGRVGRDVAVTCWDRIDGAGSQASGVVSAMLLARHAGCRYLHSPFASMAHAVGDSAEWAMRWERFFNLGDGETPATADVEVVRLSAFVRAPEAYAGRNVVIGEPGFALPPHELEPVRDKLRAALRVKYWRSPKTSIPSHRSARGLTVAVHLRRGDVDPSYPGRYAPEDRVLRRVLRLREELALFGVPAAINLYSEGTPEQFRAFAEAGCTLHLSEDPFESFHNMVTADILMTGVSTFSRFAALLSEGIILHWNRKSARLSNYLRWHPNRDIPVSSLRRALVRRMGWWKWWVYWARRTWR
jgi:hypothetical protein